MNNWEYLIEKMSEFDIVSFDIFDTLLLRAVWEPSDLFFFVGLEAVKKGYVKKPFDFLVLRKEAESSARKKLCSNKIMQEITLEQIYKEVQHKLAIKDSTCKDLMQIEVEKEKEFICPRKSAYELYSIALNRGKKIICISDMYLSNKELMNILNMNGFTKIDKIYISSEIKLSKQMGNLYHFVRDDLKIKENQKILHIGDNYYADVEMAQKSGFSAFYLPQTKVCFKKEHRFLISLNFRKRIYYAVAVNVKYDNPFLPALSNMKQYIDINTKYNNDLNSDKAGLQRMFYFYIKPEIKKVLSKAKRMVSI